MGNLLNSTTSIICADSNDKTVDATLCAPTYEINRDDFFEVGTTPVTCEDCQELIAAARAEALTENADDEVTDAYQNGTCDHPKTSVSNIPSVGLLGLLGALAGDNADKVKVIELDEDGPRESTLDELFATLAGMRPATADNTKATGRHRAEDSADETELVELSDEARIVATTLFRAMVSWKRRGSEDPMSFAAGTAADTLADLIAEDLYPDDEAKRETFIRISHPTPLVAALLGL